MEKISINQSERRYEIESIRPITKHVIQIVFAGVDKIPGEYGDVQVYTEGGIQCANLPGYDTVYRDEGRTVYLSDDGSRYPIPAAPASLRGWNF